MEQGRTFRISMPKFPTKDPNHRILAHQRSRFTHYYFYIRDEVLGPIIVRVASFFPFHATYWLNGHSFIEQELKRRRINFQKNDNAFLAVDDAAELQAAADRLSPPIIRKQLNYWTLILGPKFSKRERGQMNLSRFYAIAQIEYCRNFVFKRHYCTRNGSRSRGSQTSSTTIKAAFFRIVVRYWFLQPSSLSYRLGSSFSTLP